jgi:predicted transcriptional regulator
MSENIWKKETLKQMNRFNSMQITEIIKNLIVISLYEKKWHETKIKHKIIPLKKYPYYRIQTTDDTKIKTIEEYLTKSKHMQLINDIIELFIGRDGLARAEVFTFISALDAQMRLAEAQPQKTPL